jgi:hypothetical protein
MSDHLLLHRLIAERKRKEHNQQVLDVFDQTVNLPLAKEIYAKLEKHYPGNYWNVTVELERGKIYIELRHLDTGGYFISPEKLGTDTSLKCVVEGGGHLLERYRLNRGKADAAQLAEVVEKHGDPIFRKHLDAPE